MSAPADTAAPPAVPSAGDGASRRPFASAADATGERSPHQRVRWAMLGVIAVMALLQALQWHQAGAMARSQAADEERLRLVASQRLHNEHIARMAAMSQRERAEAALERALARSREDAAALEARLPTPSTPAVESWLEGRERLWAQADALLAGLRGGDVARLGPLMAEVERESQGADLLLRTLGDELQRRAHTARDGGAGALQRWALLSTGLLLLLAMAVVEPVTRHVRRQHERLSAQARELERLAMVAERTHNLVVVTDAQRRITWVNDAFTRVTGYGLDEARGQVPGRLLQSDRTDPQTIARIRVALDAGQGARGELLNRARDGSDYWVDVDIQPMHDDDGALAGFVAVETVITEQVTQRLQLAALLAALPVGVMVKDSDGRVVDCNPAAQGMLGRPRDVLIGHGDDDLRWRALREDLSDYPLAEQPSTRTLASGEPVRGEVVGVMRPDGELRWLLVNSEPLRDALGRGAGVIACFVDVTEQRARDRLLALTIEGSGVGVWQWQVADGTVSGSDRLWRMLGYRRDDVPATEQAWTELVHPDDRETWVSALQAHLRDPQTPYRCLLRLRRADGSWASVVSSGSVIERSADGRPRHMAGTHVDMTEQLQMQARLSELARTDVLTCLPNRAVVFERVAQALQRHRAHPAWHFAVLFMDFDRFKHVNDTYGHGAGDELLRQIAQRLQGELRSDDLLGRPGSMAGTAARIGGDEFVVLLEGLSEPDAATVVAQRLLDVLARPYAVAGRQVHSSASIGVVTSISAGPDAETVLRDADTAMYEAKRAGRGRWVQFDPSMHERLARQMGIESDLRRALVADELSVVYQPVVDLADGRICGVEALVRWRHPTRGAISPAEFIPVAEECGLIGAVGAFVLRSACTRLAQWRRELGRDAPATLAVNLSRAQLKAPGLVAEVRHVLAESELPAPCLQLEVTESLAAQDEQVQTTLRQLKALGVRLALDDFGTGYSSLACLHLLPVDTVKIDRSFVSQLEASEYHRTLIEATIRVARSLSMDTVAEGIETPTQALQLFALDCNKGQGYLYSPPLAPDALAAFVGREAAPAQARAA